ncbi:thermonuclease family protein [Methylibium sp.]|uniref:thermonuclease family protein n=1 Tax=Methylibium sp. TaxID=2067992 RepID=UPI0025F19105|nr:thermonuclease family protein [Methylibium sp.]
MLSLCLALTCAIAAAGETRFSGVVTRVSDGDTVWVQPDQEDGAPHRKRVKLRLVGLDAPERCQAHGPEAGAALASRVQGRHVTVRRRATDDYGRALGTLWVGDEDVGAWMVNEGHAWSARWRGSGGPYASEEGVARNARRGLFAAEPPFHPRDFRRLHGPCDAPRTQRNPPD